jgi:hypothetical protein
MKGERIKARGERPKAKGERKRTDTGQGRYEKKEWRKYLTGEVLTVPRDCNLYT